MKWFLAIVLGFMLGLATDASVFFPIHSSHRLHRNHLR